MHIVPIRTTAPPDRDAIPFAIATQAMRADARLGEVAETIGDHIGHIYAQRRALTATEAVTVARLRACLAAISDARAELETMMTERAL